MTRKKLTPEAKHLYAYHVQDPFKTLQPMHDKYGVLHFISMEQFLKEVETKPNKWQQTTFESLMPPICIGVGFLLFCFIIGTAL